MRTIKVFAIMLALAISSGISLAQAESWSTQFIVIPTAMLSGETQDEACVRYILKRTTHMTGLIRTKMTVTLRLEGVPVVARCASVSNDMTVIFVAAINSDKRLAARVVAKLVQTIMNVPGS